MTHPAALRFRERETYAAPWMTRKENDRYLAGRYDWREKDWQDHCGEPECKQCEGAFIPEGNPVVAEARRRILRDHRWLVPE